MLYRMAIVKYIINDTTMFVYIGDLVGPVVVLKVASCVPSIEWS